MVSFMNKYLSPKQRARAREKAETRKNALRLGEVAGMLEEVRAKLEKSVADMKTVEVKYDKDDQGREAFFKQLEEERDLYKKPLTSGEKQRSKARLLKEAETIKECKTDELAEDVKNAGSSVEKAEVEAKECHTGLNIDFADGKNNAVIYDKMGGVKVARLYVGMLEDIRMNLEAYVALMKIVEGEKEALKKKDNELNVKLNQAFQERNTSIKQLEEARDLSKGVMQEMSTLKSEMKELEEEHTATVAALQVRALKITELEAENQQLQQTIDQAAVKKPVAKKRSSLSEICSSLAKKVKYIPTALSPQFASVPEEVPGRSLATETPGTPPRCQPTNSSPKEQTTDKKPKVEPTRPVTPQPPRRSARQRQPTKKFYC